jgi:hypothetical protein
MPQVNKSPGMGEVTSCAEASPLLALSAVTEEIPTLADSAVGATSWLDPSTARTTANDAAVIVAVATRAERWMRAINATMSSLRAAADSRHLLQRVVYHIVNTRVTLVESSQRLVSSLILL